MTCRNYVYCGVSSTGHQYLSDAKCGIPGNGTDKSNKNKKDK